MALTGELTDLSLAELIEFFCNQRKTGRLKVIYPSGPGYFYLQSGSVVHARIGDLRGIEAVYYALTLRNASFTFSPAFEAPEHTINQPWTSVVLEGLRRMDEGIIPQNPFSETAGEPAEEIKAEPIEHKASIPAAAVPEPKAQAPEPPRPRVTVPPTVPFLSQVEAPSRFATSKWKLGAVIAAIVLIVAVVAVPWSWYARSKAAKLANETKAVAAEPSTASSQVPLTETPAAPSETEASPAANAEALDLAKRQREARLREEARRERALDTAESQPVSQSSPAAPQPVAKDPAAPASGSKKVTVQVTYDENGRVTQASGGDATALRIARQKRFPAGKAGSAIITIPIN